MIDILIGDVLKQILIGGDGERRRTVAPHDLKTAVGFDFGKIAHRSSVGRKVAVAYDTAPATAGSEQEQAGQESDRNLIHNSTPADEMTSAACLDSRMCRYWALFRDFELHRFCRRVVQEKLDPVISRCPAAFRLRKGEGAA